MGRNKKIGGRGGSRRHTYTGTTARAPATSLQIRHRRAPARCAARARRHRRLDCGGEGDRLRGDILDMLTELVERIVGAHFGNGDVEEIREGLRRRSGS